MQAVGPPCFNNDLLNLLADDAEKIDENEYAWRQRAIGGCLKKLSEENQQLVMAPYLNHGPVKVLAAKQSVSVNSLTKARTLKDKLWTVLIHKGVIHHEQKI